VLQGKRISFITGWNSVGLYTYGMETQQRQAVGVDIVGNRFTLCILDEDGKHPSYYSGRVDTPLGQAHFFNKVGKRRLLMPSSDLAVLALKLLESSQVVIKDEQEHYAVWAAAGVERGRHMARFAALQLHQGSDSSIPITAKQEQQLLLLQDAELASLLSVVGTSQQIAEDVLQGRADGKTYTKALGNEVKSRQDPVIGAVREKEPEASPFAEEDTGFLARVYRELENLK